MSCRALALVLACSFAALTGCVDNSGGPAPEGTELEEFSPAAGDAGGLFCEFFRDDAFLLVDRAAVEDFFANECAGNEAAVEDELATIADGLEEGEALVVVSIQLGGCLGEWGVHGFYESEDGSTVTAWVLRADSSYGRTNWACTDDIGGAIGVYRVMGAADATEADIVIGTYNPDLPGAPAQPGQ